MLRRAKLHIISDLGKRSGHPIRERDCGNCGGKRDAWAFLCIWLLSVPEWLWAEAVAQEQYLRSRSMAEGKADSGAVLNKQTYKKRAKREQLRCIIDGVRAKLAVQSNKRSDGEINLGGTNYG